MIVPILLYEFNDIWLKAILQDPWILILDSYWFTEWNIRTSHILQEFVMAILLFAICVCGQLYSKEKRAFFYKEYKQYVIMNKLELL